MATTTATKGLNRKVAGLPAWAWGAAIIAGLLLGYLVVRRRSNPAAASPATGSLPTAYTGLSPSSGVSPSAPADSLGAGTLALLGEQLGINTQALVTTNGQLAALASSSGDNLTALGINATNASFSFAQAALDNITTPSAAAPAPVAPAPAPAAAPPPQPITILVTGGGDAPPTGGAPPAGGGDGAGTTPAKPPPTTASTNLSGDGSAQVVHFNGASIIMPTGNLNLTPAQQQVRQASGRGPQE